MCATGICRNMKVGWVQEYVVAEGLEGKVWANDDDDWELGLGMTRLKMISATWRRKPTTQHTICAMQSAQWLLMPSKLRRCGRLEMLMTKNSSLSLWLCFCGVGIKFWILCICVCLWKCCVYVLILASVLVFVLLVLVVSTGLIAFYLKTTMLKSVTHMSRVWVIKDKCRNASISVMCWEHKRKNWCKSLFAN